MWLDPLVGAAAADGGFGVLHTDRLAEVLRFPTTSAGSIPPEVGERLADKVGR